MLKSCFRMSGPGLFVALRITPLFRPFRLDVPGAEVFEKALNHGHIPAEQMAGLQRKKEFSLQSRSIREYFIGEC